MEEVLFRKLADSKIKEMALQDLEEIDDHENFCVYCSKFLQRRIEEDFIWHPSNEF